MQGAEEHHEPACRARLRATTPLDYRWQRHVGLIAAFVLAGFVVTWEQLAPLGLTDWLWFVVFSVFLNFGEYATHRWSLHRRVFPKILYHRHVVEHHGFFTFDAMEISGIEDIRWVLFPWWALPLLLVTTLPMAWLLAAVASAQVAWIFLMAVTVYYGIYEILHTLAHLPDRYGWAAHPRIRALTYHHRVHHEPRLMHHYNFNFVVAPFDYLFGTTYQGDPRG